jgi:hypothetical protein
MTHERAAAAPPFPVLTGPAINPMVLNRRMLLPILDANALLVEACGLAKHHPGKITGLAGTGRSNPYVAAHVPDEVDEHLAELAADFGVPKREARRALDECVWPAVRVVDLEIRDHLSPETQRIVRVDLEMPRKYRGDPDDAPTMALAQFLGPSVIVSQDKVFDRFGFAVDEWILVAQGILRMAGLEATAADAMVLINLVLELSGMGVHRLGVMAARNPLVATVAVGGLLWWCHRHSHLTRASWRRRLTLLEEAAEPLVEMINAAVGEHRTLSDSLVVVEPPAAPTSEQVAARYLARCGRSLTPGELRDALARHGHVVSAAQLKRDMSNHRAFVRAPGDVWTIGRPVRQPGA